MKSKTVILAVAAALVLSGCGVWERFVGKVTGYSEMCIRGVTYYQFTSGAAVGVDVTGKPIPCK